MLDSLKRLWQRNAQPDDFKFPSDYDIQSEREITSDGDYLPTVDVSDVLSIPAAFQAITDIAEKIASLELRVYRLLPDGTREYTTDHFILDLLSRGNAYQTGYDVRRTQVMHLVVEGNSFSELAVTEAGDLTIATVTPDRVALSVVDGRKLFTVDGGADQGGEERFFHIAGPSYRGLRGMSPRHIHTRTFSTAIELDRYVFSVANKSRKPSLKIITTHQLAYTKMVGFVRDKLTPMLKSLLQLVVPLPPGTDIQEFGTPHDSKSLNETRNEVNVKDIARIFDVPSSRLGNTEAATYNNVLQDQIRYVRGTIQGRIKNIEEAYKRHFLMSDEYLEHDIEPLLQGEFQDMIDSYQKLVAMGAVTPEAAAEILGLEADSGTGDQTQ